MKLSPQEIDFLKRNEMIIESILKKRIDDLKEEILETPEDKRNNIISFIREYKAGLGVLKEINSDQKSDNFTGI